MYAPNINRTRIIPMRGKGLNQLTMAKTAQKFEDEIKGNQYASVHHAQAAVKRSSLSKDEKKRLAGVITDYYSSGLPIDRLVPTVTIGKEPAFSQLDFRVMNIAMSVLAVALEHKLSREQVLDMVKERLVAPLT